ncbi:penicillin-binding transpeptidase domain-containing protein [Planococcus shenhongbingii]|uniref:Penicillin-binding transpeptidase domain-containing protein n=1 Tax=Planococcus shenhongbingii TaxID=3058398 RepID=A0ABT8NEC1_9BACL|nr:penicillin-binding transpeptidase domain-containing protein [Planococcus sp. N017]MDN7246212.1 penicillin-binding transpeptidase domain-containing protein [Planococcus sp. N017]
MRKNWVGLLILGLFVFLAGCSQQATPEDRLETYIGYWNKGEFTEMYDGFLNDGTKEAYDKTQFVERQQKLKEDLGIENLEVSYTKPAEDTEWNAEQPADFPVQIKMDTIAGPVEFEKTLTLLHEKHGETEDWFVEWDPSFIFPQLEAEDEIRIDSIEAVRGEILDRNGLGIAVNGGGYNIGVVPEKFTDKTKKAELAKILNLTVEEIDAELGQSWVKPELFVPLAKIARNNTEVLDKAIAIPGVAAQQVAMREYPYAEALGHLTGYIGSITAEQLEERKGEGYASGDQIGRQGLERALEKQLRGKNGVRIWIDKPAEGAEPITVAEQPVTDGENVTLTIDAELQKKAFAAMKGEPGAAAAVNPDTGETLALVSSPSFDPNEFMLGISGDRFKELEADPKTPLFNRFAQAYAPGSTLKPVTAAIGMEAGTLDPAEGLEIKGKTWQNVSRLHPEAPNPIDLNKALVYSDNIYFAQQAVKMGNETFVEGLKKYGFGEDIPFAMNLAASQISNDGTIDSDGQLAATSFGQGQMLTNILHLAAMYEPFLTDGKMYKPTLLLDEEDSQVWKEGLISAENAATLRTGMRKVVVDGYAQSANVPGLALAGKTGTAELKATGEERGKENGFFVTYNEDEPDMLLAIMIENVEDNGGSDYVAEMAAQIFK